MNARLWLTAALCLITQLAFANIAIGSESAKKATINNAQKQLSPAKQRQIEQVIRNYLVSNPEILVEAQKALIAKRKQAVQAHISKAIPENTQALFFSKSPSAGNAKGKITIVEFFDYQCRHCKEMTMIMDNILANNKDVRIVYKDYPIIDNVSRYAAKAALAAAKQGKYLAFHRALMQAPTITKETINKLAESLALDPTRFADALKSPAVEDQLEENRELGEKLGIRGTPAMIIASQLSSPEIKSYFIAGATSQKKLQAIITDAAKESKTAAKPKASKIQKTTTKTKTTKTTKKTKSKTTARRSKTKSRRHS